MTLTVYLSGEIHTDWRERLTSAGNGSPTAALATR